MKGLEPAIHAFLEAWDDPDVIYDSYEVFVAPIREAIEHYDEPEYQCPLCGQAKAQPATEILRAIKSCEVWSADGTSWTFLNSSYEGDLEAMLEDMLKVIRGEVT